MKKIDFNFIMLFLVINLFGYLTSYAEVPENISYQAVVRNSSGELVTESSVGVQISIIKDTPEGDVLYVERHFPNSNTNGLVSFEIGDGLEIDGSYGDIDWTGGLLFVKTEFDPLGGANYTISNTSQLLSVPFALHASSADYLSYNNSLWTPSDITSSEWVKTGNNLHYDEGRVFIGRSSAITGSEYFGIRAPGAGSSYGGMYIDTESATGLPFYGYATGGAAKAWSYYNSSNGSWRLYNNGDKLTITQDGNVGFHTGTPTHDLTLRHRLVTNSATQSYGLKIQNAGANNNSWHFYTQNNIGDLYLYFNDVQKGRFNDDTGAYSTLSDSRLKKDITTVKGVLADVLKLAPQRYRYTFQNEKSDRYVLGFFAEEVKEYFPELVFGGEKDDAGEDYYSLDYSAFSVIAIKAIQEQQVEIEDLRKEIVELKKVMKQLVKE